MPETENLYEILHLHPSAHPDVVQAAYRRLALLYHPDRNPSPEAAEMMTAVNRAYAVLSDPEQRAEYDRRRAAQADSSGSRPSAASSSQASRPQSSPPRSPTYYFTLGSSKGEVVNIQGVPTSIVERDNESDSEEWEYGILDTVDFDQGRVVGWMNFTGDLKVRLIPGSNTTSKSYFEIGDHPDDVARLQGTPPMVILELLWLYREGTVEFSHETGRVSRVDNKDGSLKTHRSSSSPSSRDNSWRTSTSNGPRVKLNTRWKVLSNERNNVVIHRQDNVYLLYELIVRFRGRDLEIYVNWRDEISFSDTTTVNYQIDNGPTWRQSWNVSTGRMATFMPSQDVAETIRALLDAEEFTVRVYPFGGNPITASFDVSGFREAVGPVLDAWRRAGSPAPGAAVQGGGCFLLPVSVLSAAAVASPTIWFLL